MVSDATVENGVREQEPRVVDASAQSEIALSSDFRFLLRFERLGDDLLLRSAGGKKLILEGYYLNETPPVLKAAGAVIKPPDDLGLLVVEWGPGRIGVGDEDNDGEEVNDGDVGQELETGAPPPESGGSTGESGAQEEIFLFAAAAEENRPSGIGSSVSSETNSFIIVQQLVTNSNDSSEEILLFRPDAQDDNVVTDEDTLLPGSVLVENGNGADGGGNLTVIAVNGDNSVVGSQILLVSGALLTLNADGGFVYDPNGQFDDLAVGESRGDSFTYAVSNALGTDNATVTITVDGVNDPPRPQDDEGSGFATDEDSAFTTANVLANDEDIDSSDVLTVTGLDTSGTLGQVTDNGDGTFNYDPNGQFENLAANETATDRLTYEVFDGNGGTNTAMVTVEIIGINDGPVLIDNNLTLEEGDRVTLTQVELGATDPDNDAGGLVFTVSGLAGGQFELAADSGVAVTSFTQQQVIDGQVVFVDDGDETAPSYSLSVSDGDLATAPALAAVNFTNVNDPPVVIDDVVATNEDDTLTFDVREDNGNGADSDAEGEGLTVTTVEGQAILLGDTIELSSGAELTLNPDGTFTYDPDGQFDSLAGGESAEDSFTYRVSDGADESAEIAAVTITIDGVDGAGTTTSNAALSQGNAIPVPGDGILSASTSEFGDPGLLTFAV